MSKVKTISELIICLLIPLSVGGIAGYATAAGVNDWYAALNKPSFNPPGYVFGPVWTFLYLLMGISLFIIWKSPQGHDRTNALTIFFVQLFLNFAWSFLFFRFHQPGWALADIVLIWIGIITMIILFKKISRTAALIQIPYLLWVSFATILNAAIWQLN